MRKARKESLVFVGVTNILFAGTMNGGMKNRKCGLPLKSDDKSLNSILT